MLLIFNARANYSATQNGKRNRIGIGNELVRMAATNYSTNKIYIPIRVRFTLQMSRREREKKKEKYLLRNLTSGWKLRTDGSLTRSSSVFHEILERVLFFTILPFARTRNKKLTADSRYHKKRLLVEEKNLTSTFPLF